MALVQRDFPIAFNQGLDTKTDPFQVMAGKFLSLQNSIFDTEGLLRKRNGFGQLTSLPNNTYNFITTFNDDLTAISPTNFQAYAAGAKKWVDKGNMQNLSLSTLSMIKNNYAQSSNDSVVAPNNLVCVTYLENSVYKYAVLDAINGQNIVAPTAIVSTGTVTYAPKVFLLGNYFVIVFDSVITAVNHLQYVAINIYSLLVTTAADISTSYAPAATGSFDGVVANNILYLAWNGADMSHAIRMTSINSILAQSNTVTFASRIATLMSVCADNTGPTPVIYAVFYNLGTTTGYALAVDHALNTVHAPVQVIASGTYLNLASTAQNGVCTFLAELSNAYTYDSSIATNLIKINTFTQGGTVGTASTLVRSVGLASKGFLVNGNAYFLAVYSSTIQPTYFLMSNAGQVISKLAYSNGGGYYTTGLPNVTVDDDLAYISYQYKDLLVPVNKAMNAPSAPSVYTQAGLNLVAFDFLSNINTAEIGNDLHLTGGFLWMYDGYLPVEHNFFLFPDSVEGVVTQSGGSMTTQDYFYQAIYQWTDNQGNIFNSAPSIPIKVPSASFSGSSNLVTLYVPTIRLTYKIANAPKIVLYRWSTAQQSFYQVTSISSPTLNDPTVDYITFVDTLADTSIVGNSLIYTNGGVVENISANPPTNLSLFKSRLFYIDAEDRNLLGYSKKVIEATPVELSDLFTLYVAPTTAAQGNTGPMQCIFPMDDKLIIWKKNAIYYITGDGPDNTGANNDFSDPVFITSSVGCSNQSSITMGPAGLFFQSDKGIWLLGRDLSTTYIGAPVEKFNSAIVVSALTIPGTNQVRFVLDNGITLMFDYFFQQWAVFYGIQNISSTLYNDLHSYIDQYGRVFQETPGKFLDGNNPVLMQFTTSWFSFAGIQGLQRIFEFYFLGTYLSPHKLNVQIGYDYNPTPNQTILISPDNFSGVYGSDPLYGDSQFYGGNLTLEQWRIFFNQQKVQSFQILVQEIFDPSYGTVAGAGFTMSGLNLTVGILKGKPLIAAKRAVG